MSLMVFTFMVVHYQMPISLSIISRVQTYVCVCISIRLENSRIVALFLHLKTL